MSMGLIFLLTSIAIRIAMNTRIIGAFARAAESKKVVNELKGRRPDPDTGKKKLHYHGLELTDRR